MENLLLLISCAKWVDIRSLDGEKKALVYDNYSKLITATDTIRKVGFLLGKLMMNLKSKEN